MPYAGRSRTRRRSVGRPRRRSTTVRLQDKASFHNQSLPVYSRKGSPIGDRVIFPRDESFKSASIGTRYSVRYLGRTYSGRKSVRLVNRGGKVNSVPVIEFETTTPP